MQFIIDHKLELIAFCLALSEALALIPSIQSNSIFQLIVNGLKKLKEFFAPAAPAA